MLNFNRTGREVKSKKSLCVIGIEKFYPEVDMYVDT